MNAEVELMKRTPGKYVVSNGAFREHGQYALVEVDEDGFVFRTNNGRKLFVCDDAWSPDTTVWKNAEPGLVRINDPEDRISLNDWRQRA